MSQSARRETEIVQWGETTERSPDRPPFAGGHDLAREAQDTVRKILQYVVLVLLLSNKLYVLPLVYLYQTLTMPDDCRHVSHEASQPATHADTTQRSEALPGLPTRAGSVVTAVRDAVFTPLRIAKALYSLGEVLEAQQRKQGTTVLRQLGITSITSFDHDMRDEHRSRCHDDSEVTSSADESITGPGSRQHIDLSESGSPDDLLSVHDTPDGARGPLVARVLLRGGPRTQLSAEELKEVESRKRQRYLGNGMQENAREPLSPKCGTHVATSPSVQASLRSMSGPEVRPEEDTLTSEEQNQSGPDREAITIATPASVSSDVPPSARSSKGTIQHVSGGINLCPTYTRRHARSRLPQRVSSDGGSKLPFTRFKASGAMSTPELSTPTKRARLQRRNGPKQDALRS